MLALALDIGGSHAICAVLREKTILASRECSIAPASFRQILPCLEQLVSGTVNEAEVGLEQCSGIVLGFPGIVDSRQGIVIATNAKFDDAIQLDLPSWSRQAFGLPLFLDNDARLALLGEQYCGAAEGALDTALITLGTGIGAAAMLGGKPLRGRYDQAGCLGGHLPVVLNGNPCTCGNVGCAEAEASTWALPHICRAFSGFENSRLASAAALDFSCVFSAADAGDAIAQAVLKRCCSVWAALAVALIHAYSPSVLLFGGGVMARADDILPPIRQHVERHAWTPRGQVKITAAALGSAAPLYGAIPLITEMTQ